MVRILRASYFVHICKLLEITKTRSTPYHPAGKGQCEVFNKIILQMISANLSSGFWEWDKHLSLIAMSMHSMKNRSTGYSANMFMLGRKTIQPIDLMLGIQSNSPQNMPG